MTGNYNNKSGDVEIGIYKANATLRVKILAFHFRSRLYVCVSSCDVQHSEVRGP